MAKERVDIPEDLAAEVLFRAHRTCCVCRVPRKPVQLHHIDGNPANSTFDNLAALCLEDHDDTQLRGGFGWKLDAAQVRRYRDDWYAKVEDARNVLNLAPTAQLEVTQEARPEVLEHDRRVFRSSNEILPEAALDNVLGRLCGDNSYLSSQFHAMLDYVQHLRSADNEYILGPLRDRAAAVASALDKLTDFTARHFFDWPRGQQAEDKLYCLYPEFNVDRGGDGDPEKMALYDRRQQELVDLADAVYVAWRDYRRAVKLTLVI